MPQIEEEPGFNFLDYWRIIKKRRWMILTIIVVVTTIVTIWTFRQIPFYRASTTIQVDPPSTELLNFKDIINQETNDVENMQTQTRVLNSKALAMRVVEQLDLVHDPAFGGKVSPALSHAATGAASAPIQPVENGTAPSPPDDPVVKGMAGRVRGGLQINPVGQARILELSYISSDPKLAARLVNAYANAYIDFSMESRYNATQRASDWLMKQSLDLKSKLEKSETALAEYAQKSGIIFLDQTPSGQGDKGGGGQNTVMQQLGSLNDELTKSQSERIRIEALYRQVHSSSGVEITLFRESPLIKALNEQLIKVSQQYAEMSAKFEPGWPALGELKSQIDLLDRQIEEEKKRIIKTIDTDYFSALSRERSFKQAFEQQKLVANELNDKQIHYNILKREVDTNRQLYDGLLQRLKEASVSAGLKGTNIRVLDAAEVPGAPFIPDNRRNITMGFIVSILSGLGVAFLLEYVDRTVKTPEQTERHLKLPSLAMIPMLSAAGSRKLLTSGSKIEKDKSHVVDLISHTSVKSLISEAFRALRTSVLLSTNGRPPRSILVTSPGPGEGKSVTAVNLAITLAQTGAKVLIVDVDMRRPRLQKIFEIPKENPGFSAYLSGNTKLVPLIVETQVPNLYVIPAGATPPNPSELIGSNLMRQSIDLLTGHFDYVVIDSPPVMSVTDPTILSTLVEGVVLVLHGGKTNRDMAARAAQRLKDVGARIFGTVLNNVDMKSPDYDYYYHQYYYYSYYADEKDKKGSPQKGTRA